MSALGKLRGTSPGKSEGAFIKFKKLWLGSLSDSDRAYWCSLFSSNVPQALIREEIAAKLSIHLKNDGRLTEFRQWIRQQQSGLDNAAATCFEESKDFPEVQRLFRLGFEMLNKAKAEKGKIQ